MSAARVLSLLVVSLFATVVHGAGGLLPGRTHFNLTQSDDGLAKPDFYRERIMAFPNGTVDPAQSRAARNAWKSLNAGKKTEQTWKLVAPDTNPVDPLATYTGRGTSVSGRVTALALTPGCAKKNPGPCRLYLGAAGGGVWRMNDPFGNNPKWEVASDGIDSMAIGALAVDPNGKGEIVYAGTGEGNLSGDSEAGVGLYRSNDGGKSWALLPASMPFSDGLSIASIAIDPRDSAHLYFGTGASVHGSAASADASRPPNTAALGVFESDDGGATFSRIYTAPAGPAVVGGVNQISLDPNALDTVYITSLGVGLLRKSAALDGNASFHLVFKTGVPNDGFNRLAFALADRGNATRIYLGDSIDATSDALLYRTDIAGVPAHSLFDGTSNVGWTTLSSATDGTPGFASFGFCQTQCFYDIFVGSPPGDPDTVWIGGSMNYDELFGPLAPRSNGRAVMRSTDAGVHFADMTNDARNPAEGMHPDQHAIVFNPDDPGVAIIGSDGGVVRTDGKFVDASGGCAARGLAGHDLTDCKTWLKAIPRQIDSINAGLSTLQFQSVSVNPRNPANEWMGGTQDNGTFAFGTKGNGWFETIGGDGGQSGFDAVNPNIRVHSYFDPAIDVNFRGSDPLGWNWISDPLYASNEKSAFYIPLITDPVVGGSMFAGLQHVFRTRDSGGPQAYLEQHCNEFTGDFMVSCGDWMPLGGDLTGPAFGGNDRKGRWVVSIARSGADHGTMWAATFPGRLFITRNADASNPAAVNFVRVDNATTPGRVPSDIVVDPADGQHAWVAYSGYGAYTPTARGHVFELKVPLSPGPATVTDISYNLGDMPITGLVRDDTTGDLYAATDFGVLQLAAGDHTWKIAGQGLPPAAVYHLTLTSSPRLLYAATHGRSVWRMSLD